MQRARASDEPRWVRDLFAAARSSSPGAGHASAGLARRGARAVALTLLPAAAFGLGFAAERLAAPPAVDVPAPPPEALAGITESRLGEDVRALAAPALEGRDTPSVGLDLALRRAAERFAALGLVPAPDSSDVWRRVAGEAPPPDWAVTGGGAAPERSASRGVWIRPYLREALLFDRVVLHAPVPEACRLAVTVDGTVRELVYGEDFVPLAEFAGTAEGALEFAGFGIDNDEARYDDFRGVDVRGKVVVILSGEPRHARLFDGLTVTAEASVWNKLDALATRGAAGAIVVRRPPELARGEEPPQLSYRWTRATWLAPTNDKVRATLPAVEVDAEAGEALLGFDPLDWAEKVDRSGKPAKRRVEGRVVSLRATTRTGPVALPNIVACLPGADPTLAAEHVVLGAHFDHIGVDPREQVGPGADDNASGAAALLAVAEAFAKCRPARTVWFVGFSAEEDGLIGSAAFVAAPPMPTSSIAAMVNLDMIGRGDADEVVVLGLGPNPGMRATLNAAQRLGKTGISRIDECSDAGLFQRSDHHSFHVAGVPTVFFFENFPLEQNKDYHTWRDATALVDIAKVRNTARLAFLTAWVLANEPERLEAPR